MDYRIKENSLVARIAAWKLNVKSVAVVIGHTIHLHNASKQQFLNNKRWVRHELKHLEQFRKDGVLIFITKYLIESIKKGYWNNKYEIEARAAEGQS
jgi:hypothetical protein